MAAWTQIAIWTVPKSLPTRTSAEYEASTRTCLLASTPKSPRRDGVRYVGERGDLAAVLKLAGNSAYFALTAAMDAALARGLGAKDFATFARRG